MNIAERQWLIFGLSIFAHIALYYFLPWLSRCIENNRKYKEQQIAFHKQHMADAVDLAKIVSKNGQP